MSLTKLYDINNLYKSFLAVKKQSGWKSATQKYDENYLTNLIKLREKLITKTYVPSEPKRFLLNERGKTWKDSATRSLLRQQKNYLRRN